MSKARDLADSVAAGSVLADGVVSVSEITSASGANLNFADNSKAIFGAGSDLQIYHDDAQSTNFLISQNSANISVGTAGTVNVGSSGSNVNVNGAVALVQGNDQVSLSGATVTTTTGPSGVVLDNNGSAKLATTSTGIDVTGMVVADGLTVEGSGLFDASNAKVTIKAFAPALILEDDSAAGASSDKLLLQSVAGQTLGDYEFVLNNDQTSSTDRTAIKIAGNGDISFYEDTGTTPKFFWDASTESLGIGTDTPESFWGQANKLVVGGSGNQGISIYGTSTSRLAFVDTTTGNPGLDSGGLITYNHTDEKFLFSVAGNNRLSIQSNGHVGMGTDTPDYKLEIVDGSSRFFYDSTTFGIITNTAGGYGRFLTIWNSNTSGDNQAVGLGNLTGRLIFSTGFQGDTESPVDGEAMTILADGNVGINTNAPATMLELSANNNTLSGSPPTNILRFNDTDVTVASSQPTGRIEFYVNDATAGGTGIGSYIEGRTSGNVGGGYLAFATSTSGATGATEGMRFINGDLGIGETAPAVKLHVTGSSTYVAGIEGSSASAYLGLRASGSGGSMADPTVGVGANVNNLVFRAGGAERARINSAGNVGIGNTSPTQKLDVTGTVKATAFVGDGSGLTGIPGFGVGQTWQTVSRSSGVTYTNSTGKPIQIALHSTSGGTGLLTVGGVVINRASNNFWYTATVPNGVGYSFNGGWSVWTELR